MAPKKKATAKPLSKTKLTAKQAETVKGGLMRRGAESCKESGDSGMMGCGTG